MRFKKYFEIFITFFKIGLLTFGGGYAMIAVMQRDVVEKKKWIDEDTMYQLISISEATPGPFAINGATFIGYTHAKFWGSFFATLGVVLPSFIIIILVSIFLDAFSSNVLLQNALRGIGAGVGVLIFKALWKLGKKLERNWKNIMLTAISFTVAFFTDFSIVLLLIITACFGLAYSAVKRNEKSVNQ